MRNNLALIVSSGVRVRASDPEELGKSGFDKAKIAAEKIRRQASSRSIVVLMPPEGQDTIAVRQTAETVAGVLGVTARNYSFSDGSPEDITNGIKALLQKLSDTCVVVAVHRRNANRIVEGDFLPPGNPLRLEC